MSKRNVEICRIANINGYGYAWSIFSPVSENDTPRANTKQAATMGCLADCEDVIRHEGGSRDDFEFTGGGVVPSMVEKWKAEEFEACAVIANS